MPLLKFPHLHVNPCSFWLILIQREHFMLTQALKKIRSSYLLQVDDVWNRHNASFFVTVGCFLIISGEAIPMHVRGLYAHLQHGGKLAHTSEDAPRRIHICVQPAGLRQSLSHVLQPEDPRPRPHKRKTLWVWCPGLWESLQHSLQVNMNMIFCISMLK